MDIAVGYHPDSQVYLMVYFVLSSFTLFCILTKVSMHDKIVFTQKGYFVYKTNNECIIEIVVFSLIQNIAPLNIDISKNITIY